MLYQAIAIFCMTAAKEGYVIKMIVVILKNISHDSIHAKSTMCLKPVFHNEQ